MFTMLVGCKNSNDKDQKPKSQAPISESKKAPEKEPSIDPEIAESISKGQTVYTENCAVCHQKSGGGVPNLNPPLKNADYAMGDKAPLITLLLKGSSDEQIVVNGQTYSNVMPSFRALDDDQIANVLTYVRNNFENKASAVQPSEVKEIRATIE